MLKMSIALLLFGSVLSQAAEQVPLLSIPELTAIKLPAPVIDGKINDSCWGKVPATSPFTNEVGRPVINGTSVKMLRDQEFIYLAAILNESNLANILAKVKEKDQGVWADDCFEFFISPTAGGQPYFRFAMNSIGTQEDSRNIDSAALWNIDWKGAAYVTPPAKQLAPERIIAEWDFETENGVPVKAGQIPVRFDDRSKNGLHAAPLKSNDAVKYMPAAGQSVLSGKQFNRFGLGNLKHFGTGAEVNLEKTPLPKIESFTIEAIFNRIDPNKWGSPGTILEIPGAWSLRAYNSSIQFIAPGIIALDFKAEPGAVLGVHHVALTYNTGTNEVEVFLDGRTLGRQSLPRPNAPNTKKLGIGVAVNSPNEAASLYDQIDHLRWSHGILSPEEFLIVPSFWSLEMKIPIAAISEGNLPKNATVWRGNFCRARKPSELSTWSGKTANFHNATRFGEFKFTNLSLLDSVEMEIAGDGVIVKIAGTAGDYDIKFGGSAEAKQQFKLGAGKTAVRQSYPAGKSDVFAWFEISKAGSVLYRSSEFAVKKAQQDEYYKLEVQRLLKEISTALPGELAKYTALASKAQTDLIILKNLNHEMAAKLWLKKLNPAFVTAPVLHFTLEPFVEHDYELLPSPELVAKGISARVIRGERESVAVNLMPLDQGRELTVKLTDLKTANGNILPARNCEIRILKKWYQAGTTSLNRPDEGGEWVSELLVRDDTMVKPDHEKQRNILVHRNDGPELKPLVIPRYTSRQYFLTFTIPAELAPGDYSGSLKVISTTDQRELTSVPINITVLPLTVEKTDFVFSIYYHGSLTNGKNPKQDAVNEAELRQLAEYGHNSVCIQEGVETLKSGADGETVEYDWTLVRKAIELRKKLGLTAPTFIMGTHWRTPVIEPFWVLAGEAIGKRDEQALLKVLDSKKLKYSVINYNRAMTKLADEYNFGTLYFYTWDEPGYDATGRAMRACKTVDQWCLDGGGKAAAAITMNGAVELIGNLDLPILDSDTAQLGKLRRKLPFDKSWVYWHPLENPAGDRLFGGILLWYGGYTGAASYAYQALGGKAEGWDDWNAQIPNWRPEHYVYPSANITPVPTWQLAAMREGYDDTRLLEMIDRRVKKAAALKLNPAQQAIVATAAKLVNETPEKFQASYIKLHSTLNGNDFKAFREQLLDTLLAIDQVVK